MAHEFTVSVVIPASPQAIYETWLDSEGHSKMTGSPAHITDKVGDAFDAWGGYISGRNLELDPGKRIVQAWRGKDYTEADGHSRIEITLAAAEGGTELTLFHSNIPDNQTTHDTGWPKHYFEPMKKYFGGSE